MTLRTAELDDIPEIQRIRLAVKENKLSDPSIIPDQLVAQHLTEKGKGWVAAAADCLLGFAIVDVTNHNIWALFVHPVAEGKGVGRQLHDAMLNWYFQQYESDLWLGTAPGTRAQQFYLQAGWTSIGFHANGEVHFVMSKIDWQQRQRSRLN